MALLQMSPSRNVNLINLHFLHACLTRNATYWEATEMDSLKDGVQVLEMVQLVKAVHSI